MSARLGDIPHFVADTVKLFQTKTLNFASFCSMFLNVGKWIFIYTF